jgi:hypothetical protein
MKHNPLPEIVALIPEQISILTLELSDKIRAVIYKHTKYRVDDGYIINLIAYLTTHDVIESKELTWKDMQGSVILIKRKVDGENIEQV